MKSLNKYWCFLTSLIDLVVSCLSHVRTGWVLDVLGASGGSQVSRHI